MPFEVPEGWCWTTLADISNYGECINVPVDKIPDSSWILELEDIEKDSGRLIQRRIKSNKIINGVRHSFTKSNILYSKLRTYLNKVLIADQDGYCTTEIIPITCKKGIMPEYLCHVLRSSYYVGYTISLGYGVKMPRLGTTDALKSMIPVPPTSEQARIVSAIDKLSSTIDILEANQQDAHDIADRTKAKILDLALTGKLVPQDPLDEPATRLLTRINPGYKPCDNRHYANVPFEIPKSWCWTTLGRIGKWQSGATPSRMKKEYYGGDIPWLKTGDLNDGFIRNIPESITSLALQETSVKLNPSGSVLLAMYGATIGKLGILTTPATTNQACCACVSYNGVEQMYLFYFLLSHRSEFVNQGGGGAQPNISKDKIIETLIPIPPLNEQRRIVQAVRSIFSILDRVVTDL